MKWRGLALLLLAWIVSGADGGADAGENGRLAAFLGDGPVSQRLGVNIHLADADAETALDSLKALGARLVRTDLEWSAIETRPGVYDWTRFDALVLGLEERGLRPLLILAYSNPLYTRRVATAASQPMAAFEPPTEPEARAAFIRFAAAAAGHYRARVMWEVWNEPNLNFGHPFALEGYIRLAMGACAAIRAVDPGAPVIGPAASGIPLSFLIRFVAADKAACFDALSVHPYRKDAPESVLEDWRGLSRLVARSNRVKALVSSEWGYASDRQPWSEAEQAMLIQRSFLLNLLAGVKLSILYDLRNDGPDPHDQEANFGLLDYQGAQKPAFIGLAGLLRDIGNLHLLGRIELTPERFALMFGEATGVPRVVVAWTGASRPETLSLDRPICFRQPNQARLCLDDAAAATFPRLLALDGQPRSIRVAITKDSP